MLMETLHLRRRFSCDARSIFTLNRDREWNTVCSTLAICPSDSLLDVGSGDGFWTVRFAKRCARVTGLDPDKPLVQCARTVHSRSNVSYVAGAAEALPFPEAAFDKL